jgi:hypothetical protein
MKKLAAIYAVYAVKGHKIMFSYWQFFAKNKIILLLPDFSKKTIIFVNIFINSVSRLF